MKNAKPELIEPSLHILVAYTKRMKMRLKDKQISSIYCKLLILEVIRLTYLARWPIFQILSHLDTPMAQFHTLNRHLCKKKKEFYKKLQCKYPLKYYFYSLTTRTPNPICFLENSLFPEISSHIYH